MEQHMNSTRKMMAAGLMGASLLMGACSGNWHVERHDPNDSTDVDYHFNDADGRIAAQTITQEALSRPWLDNWMREHPGKQPIVVLGNVRNDTQDYNVNPKLFTEAIEESMINSGRIRVKSEKNAREELRDERLDTKFNDPTTLKAVAKELNADFMLTGNVQQSLQQNNSGNKVVNVYQITMNITNVETAEVVFKNSEQIKKVAKK
jgi:uncharacterized protein (TIGR02722 family)